tara:strand:+ start:221 stop:481 length:261 start_codon:yes stop_codon:yes gene_type:complete
MFAIGIIGFVAYRKTTDGWVFKTYSSLPAFRCSVISIVVVDYLSQMHPSFARRKFHHCLLRQSTQRRIGLILTGVETNKKRWIRWI